MRIAFVLIVLLSLTLVADADGTVKCTMSIGRTEWSPGDRIPVEITFENEGNNSVTLWPRPFFRLDLVSVLPGSIGEPSRKEFWAAVPLDRDSVGFVRKQPGKVKRVEKLKLRPGARETLLIDLAELGWNWPLSSFWPSEPWPAVVPEGEYSLGFDGCEDCRDPDRIKVVVRNKLRVNER